MTSELHVMTPRPNRLDLGAPAIRAPPPASSQSSSHAGTRAERPAHESHLSAVGGTRSAEKDHGAAQAGRAAHVSTAERLTVLGVISGQTHSHVRTCDSANATRRQRTLPKPHNTIGDELLL